MIDVKKLQTLQKISQIAAVASLVVFGALIGASIYGLRSITRQKQVLEKQVRKLTATHDDLTRQIEAKRKETAALEEKARFSQKVLARTPSAEVERAVREEIEINPRAAQIVSRVYFHIRYEEQRAKAERVAGLVADAGFLVPGIENVGRDSPDRTELRYFRKDHPEDVSGILDALKRADVQVEAKYVPGYENSRSIRPRHYEVFFGPDF